MHARDIAKTAIITLFGLYEFLRMGFGLRNTSNTFQRMIFVYLDDIIVGNTDLASHLQHLQLLFQRLRDFGLVINGEKCEFGAEDLDFLGHRVSAEGVAPLKKKVDALLEHPQPQTVQDLQAFLGTVNFYRCFLPAAASLLQPLTDALHGEAKAKDRVPWSTEMEAAFTSIKTALASAALLAHPAPGAEICLMVDASANHVGAALQQRPSPSSSWQPLGFFSKKLNPTQQRYSAFDRELLACTAGIRHFRHMLDGREFSILTDHKPITFALARATDAAAGPPPVLHSGIHQRHQAHSRQGERGRRHHVQTSGRPPHRRTSWGPHRRTG
jgi:cleavage and polyadenylation specificity factor subunit 1